MSEAKADTDQLVDEYGDIWNEREYSKIPNVVSESFVRVSPVAEEEVRGHEGLEAFIRGLEASFSDFEVTHNERLVGEQVAMVESTFSGTHDGEFNDIPATHEEVEVPNMSVLRIESGKIQEHRTYYDPQKFPEELGATDE